MSNPTLHNEIERIWKSGERLAALKARLARLEALYAPGMFIEPVLAEIRNWSPVLSPQEAAGIGRLDKFGGVLLARPMEKYTGRGGKVYYTAPTLDGRAAYFFPMGQYGPFVEINK